MIQYHPTTILFQDKRLLITEAARGEGGRLYTMKDNKKRYYKRGYLIMKVSILRKKIDNLKNICKNLPI